MQKGRQACRQEKRKAGMQPSLMAGKRIRTQEVRQTGKLIGKQAIRQTKSRHEGWHAGRQAGWLAEREAR